MIFLRNNKWLFVVAGVCVVLTIPFILFFSMNKAGKSTSEQNSSFLSIPQFFHFNNPTPTPFATTQLAIYSISPQDQDTGVDPKSSVTVVFSRPVLPAEQQTISLRFSPPATGSANWSNDKTTLIFTPSMAFSSNTAYTTELIYGSTSTNWSFITISIPTPIPQVQKGLDQQTQLDQQWADYQNNIQQNFPWYDQLPLSGNTYFVTFEPHTQKFTANLYPNASIEKQDTDRMKQEIQSQLEGLEVDLKKYPIIWNVTPISPTPGS